MGCAESKHVAAQVDQSPFPKKLGILDFDAVCTSNNQELIIRESLLKFGDELGGGNENMTSDGGRKGEIFGNGMDRQGTIVTVGDRIMLRNGLGKILVVCLKNDDNDDDINDGSSSYHIYTTQPVLFHDQKPSNHQVMHENLPLYDFCKVESLSLPGGVVATTPGSTGNKTSSNNNTTTKEQFCVTFANESSPAFCITGNNSMCPKKRMINYYGGQTAVAYSLRGTWEGTCDSYLISANPGVDLGLMVCLISVCDEMDEDCQNYHLRNNNNNKVAASSLRSSDSRVGVATCT